MRPAATTYLAHCVVTGDGVFPLSLVSADEQHVSVKPYERETEATTFVNGIVVAAKRDLSALPDRCSEPQAIYSRLASLPEAPVVNIRLYHNQ